MPRKLIDDVYLKLPDEKFNEIIDNTIKLSICSVKKCDKELTLFKKIKREKDINLDNLYKKFEEKKITKKEYDIQERTINNTFKKTEENMNFIECSLKNCFEFMKKQLLLTINNVLPIKFKDNPEKLNRLKYYNKLFNKKKIDMKDIKKFYDEFVI